MGFNRSINFIIDIFIKIPDKLFGIFYFYNMKIGYTLTEITWKLHLKLAIITTIGYGVILYAIQFISPLEKQSLASIAFQSIFFGLVFGLGFTYLLQKKSKQITNFFTKNTESVSLDKIIYEGPANLYRGIEAVGGKIFLTETHLIFNSHKLNIQKGTTKIPYTSIQELLPCKTAKIVDNGLKVITKEGKTFQFVVNERESWVQHLREFMK